MMAYTGRLRPKGVFFFRLQVYQRVGVSLIEVYKKVGKCHLGLWKGPKGLTDEFYGFKKSRKSFVTLQLQQLKGYKVLNEVCVRRTICQKKVYEKGTFFAKNGT